MKLDDAAARLEALGNPTRLKIYRILVRAGEEGLPVGRLQERLEIAASTLSHHLKALIAVGLVTQTREGTTLICHANYDLMRGLIDYMALKDEAMERAGGHPTRVWRHVFRPRTIMYTTLWAGIGVALIVALFLRDPFGLNITPVRRHGA